jgi:hypothetical protein
MEYIKIFPYYRHPLLLASLKPTELLFLNPKQWNISNPHITYEVCVFASMCNICKLVPTLEIYLQILWTPNNAYANSIPDTTNLNVNKMSAYTTCIHIKRSSLLANHPIHLFQNAKYISRAQLTICDRNIGHYVPTVLLQRPYGSPPQPYTKPQIIPNAA